MTRKEFLEKVISGKIDSDCVEFARNTLEKIDLASARATDNRHKKADEKRKAEQPIYNAVIAFVKAHPLALTSEIGSGCDISTSKASVVCRNLVEEKVLEKTTRKVPKKGDCTAYRYIDHGEE